MNDPPVMWPRQCRMTGKKGRIAGDTRYVSDMPPPVLIVTPALMDF